MPNIKGALAFYIFFSEGAVSLPRPQSINAYVCQCYKITAELKRPIVHVVNKVWPCLKSIQNPVFRGRLYPRPQSYPIYFYIFF